MRVTAKRILVCVVGLGILISLSSCSKKYGGKNTLANYPNASTLESEIAKDTLLKLIGFWDENKNVQVVSPAQQVEITSFLYLGLHTHWVHDVDVRSMDIRPTGPYIEGVGYDNTHQRARVYYSNDVVDWLLNNRQGEIPDGSMIVKQMYPSDPNNNVPSGPKNKVYPGDKVTGWAVMIRDSKSTKDGWLWYLFFFPGTPSYSKPVLLAQYGMSYCLTCHGGADNDQNTYSYIGNLDGKGVNQYEGADGEISAEARATFVASGHGGQPSMFGIHLGDNEPATLVQSAHDHRAGQHENLVEDVATHLGDIPGELSKLFSEYVQESMSPPVSQPLPEPNPAIVDTFGRSPVDPNQIKGLPWDTVNDHTVASPDDLKSFITSSNCQGCHDASLLLGPRMPSMMVEVPDDPDVDPVDKTKYNIAIFGEWSSSMMGLAGRDPIFLAQLESEHALRPALKEWTSNLCLSCHQVAGQRQFHLDLEGKSGYYSADYTYIAPTGKHRDAGAEYGALGRDGVTCIVCHQIMPDGLGEPETFTGKFKINPEPGTVFGPFPTDEIKPYYMNQTIGIDPQYGEQITDAGLCGSCHTITLPVLSPGASKLPGDDTPHSHEQTTYLEWVNSEYSRPGTTQTCQECHMPGNFMDQDELTTIIANVEDKNFPEVANRAADELITPLPKEGYRRHTLVGLNIFANRMFQQFPVHLGVTTIDPGTPDQFGQEGNTIHRLQMTEMEMEIIASQTVSLAASIADRSDDEWRLKVDVENLAGHKFPSGVGFRRAFLQVNALSASGDVLWSSGRTNAAGVIIDQEGQPLASEFTDEWQKLQPNYTTINSEDQVQVFETRHINDQEKLTTSFLGLAKEVKDNRLLPRGWSPDGDYADETRLRALGGDVLNVAEPGSRSIEYRIPANVGDIDKVQVRLLYQAIPPYYLKDRFATQGPESDRLYYMTSHLDLSDSLAKNWSVEVASTEVQ